MLLSVLTALVFTLKYLIISVLVSFLLLFTLIILAKLWFEPRKGVCKSNVQLHGKVALITGGNSGIGLETARDLAGRGARVIIACRNADKSAKAVADIVKTTGNGNVEYRHLDLAKFSSVRQFAEDFNRSCDRLDILVNNAGCAGLKSRPSEDGLDMVMQVNYFGPFLLTRLLLDKLVASRPSRVVVVSSTLHHWGKVTANTIEGLSSDHYLRKYSTSKLCDVLWTRALARRLPTGVTVNALHPGVVKTDIFNRLPSVPHKILMGIIDLLFKTAEEGAQTSIYLSVAEEVEHFSGLYFKDCSLCDFSSVAKDDGLVEEVWRKSLILTGCTELNYKL